jgi:hypothetical protein
MALTKIRVKKERTFAKINTSFFTPNLSGKTNKQFILQKNNTSKKIFSRIYMQNVLN